MHFSNTSGMRCEGTAKFFRSLGFPHEQQGGWPSDGAGGATCDFQRPLRFEESRDTFAGGRSANASIRYLFIFRKPGDGARVVARGQIAAVCASLAGGSWRPRAIRNEIRTQSTAAPQK